MVACGSQVEVELSRCMSGSTDGWMCVCVSQVLFCPEQRIDWYHPECASHHDSDAVGEASSSPDTLRLAIGISAECMRRGVCGFKLAQVAQLGSRRKQLFPSNLCILLLVFSCVAQLLALGRQQPHRARSRLPHVPHAAHVSSSVPSQACSKAHHAA
jgi:hypothetical protein